MTVTAGFTSAEGYVAVLDSFVDPDAVARRLVAAGLALPVRAVEAVPVGADVVALLAGPETPVTQADLDTLPNLELLAATSEGYDHLPVAEAAARGIWVTHATDYCTQEVADHTLSAIVALLRGLGSLDHSVRQGNWSLRAFAPRRLGGTVLGIYGYGKIGRAVAIRATALGMRVLVYARSTLDPQTLPDGAIQVPLERLVVEAEVLSIHVPLTSGTRGLIDADFLARLQPDVLLVNVSRGEIVDEQAVADTLGAGRLAGVAVDVLSTEPPTPDNPLLHAPNVLITPHAAWYSPDVADRLADRCAQDIVAIAQAERPAGLVAAPAEG